MKVLMISAESNPLFKCGGLGDVVYSLSKKFATYKHKMTIMVPYYKKCARNFDVNKIIDHMEFNVHFDSKIIRTKVFIYQEERLIFWLIENDDYFNRDNIYGYEDDMERFAFFEAAAAEVLSKKHLHFDIAHLHDWHTGLIPGLLSNEYIKSKFIFTIHNPVFRGEISTNDINKYFMKSVNLIKLAEGKETINSIDVAIKYAIKITTVSPNHASELLDKDNPYGLEEGLKKKSGNFIGILNGIDDKEFNPAKDKFIFKNYQLDNCKSRKKENKEFLCRTYGLENSDYPLFGIVSRLTSQKGIELIIDAIKRKPKRRANFIFLGKGEEKIEQQLLKLEKKYPEKVKVIIGYSDETAHQIYAGSDFFMMPSLFEPCGIGQMIALRYGTLPIVRMVGGLKDTVIPFEGYNEDNATGLGFVTFSGEIFSETLNNAIKLYKVKRKYMKVVHNAMKEDNSWTKSYYEYLTLYESAIKLD